MCLNLIGSKFGSIAEVEAIINYYNCTDEEIIRMGQNRDEIEEKLFLIELEEELEEIGI